MTTPDFWIARAPRRWSLLGSVAVNSVLPLVAGLHCVMAASPPDYAAVEQVFAKHCLDCHAAQEPEGKLVLETFETLLQGGESGPSIIPGKSSDSLLVQLIEGSTEREGKRRIMPPGKRAKLSTDEIALVRSWIDQGAPPPAPGTAGVREIIVPKITPQVPPRRPIHALAYAAGPKLVAVGRYGEVELVSAETRGLVRTLTPHRGSVNAVAFSSDGQQLFAGGGDAGLLGEVRQWNVADGKLLRTFSGHTDALYAVALSPDGTILATGSYDQKIKLWNVQTGAELRTLSGHNGAIYDLSFRPDGRILASASADRTVKLWDANTGERRDTLAQSLKDVNAVAFSPDGKRLYGAGADNRIRLWEISEHALETTNPLLESRFAHDGLILRLVFSSDGQWLLSSASDQIVKIWHATELKEKLAIGQQPDWVSAAAFVLEDKAVALGRLDGGLQFYDATTGAALPPPKPTLARAEPRGMQRGGSTKVKLLGTHLSEVSGVQSAHVQLKVELLSDPAPKPSEVWIEVETPADLARGAYEIWLQCGEHETGKIKLHIDDLPHQPVVRGPERVVAQTLSGLPVSLWATHEKPGESEEYSFEAEAGQALVFEAAAHALGSKSDVVLTLSDAAGRVLASTSGFGSKDPTLFYAFKSAGRYLLQASELVLAGSPDHFYRLSIGAFPYVTGIFPLSVPAGDATDVQLIGHNLPAQARVKINPSQPGELSVPIPQDQFRTRREFKVLVSETSEGMEAEPNNSPDQAMPLQLPGAVAGRFWAGSGSSDADCFRLTARAGEQWVIETMAARRGSPADTKIEVLHPDGRPVERLQLQAVRDSAVTFRGIDSDTSDCRVVNWEEMELNQYLYLQGEVVKLFRAPQGPDSGFLFYNSNGKRRCYFDTSPAAHALDEPCYIVEPHPPGAKLVSNGLPVFPVFYANDDDGDRRLGTDSKLLFTAPAEGSYVLRVSDTRGLAGEGYVYRLLLRPAEPDFHLTLKPAGLAVNAGSGQIFSVEADRRDGFEGEIQVNIRHLPPGFSVSSPLVIQEGHTEAKGTLHASSGTVRPPDSDWAKVEVTASAMVEGRAFVKAVNNFGVVRLAEPPKLFVFLEPDPGGAGSAGASNKVVQVSSAAPEHPDQPLQLTIAPGQTVPALLRVVRNGHDDLITFTVENLPHGVIVDNIGLNGVLIPKGQDERQISFTAARWVPETDRLCFAVESQAGRQTSLPVLLKVRRAAVMSAGVGR